MLIDTQNCFKHGLSGNHCLRAIVFVGVLAVIGIAGGFIYYYLVPEGSNIDKGLKRLRKKETSSEPEVPATIEIPSHEKEIRRQKAELKRQREEMFSLLSSYVGATFRKIFSPKQIDELESNIRKFATGDENITGIETAKIEFVTPIDLYHFLTSSLLGAE